MTVRFISLLFTEAELETVRRCCRDDDAPNSLRAFNAAQARAQLPSPRDSVAAPLPIPEAGALLAVQQQAAVQGDVLARVVTLPPHPGKR